MTTPDPVLDYLRHLLAEASVKFPGEGFFFMAVTEEGNNEFSTVVASNLPPDTAQDTLLTYGNSMEGDPVTYEKGKAN